MKKIMETEELNKLTKTLFKNCVFFLSREIPNEIFGLAILSAGGVYGDESDSSTFRADDPRITHFVIDRPAEFVTILENKEYIQPQWIFDCINNKKLLPVSEYQPGKKLPAHLSPFYNYNEDGTYKPKKNISINIDNEEKENIQPTEQEEHNELNEMLLSKNKKKMLHKIKEEKLKKKKVNPLRK